jgi:RND family efflux transporter MFP subunit
MNFKLMMASALVMLMFTACADNAEKNEGTIHSVLTTQPEPIGNSISKSYSGIVAESKSISLGFKTSGQILRTLVKEGDYVRAGELVAILDDVDYQLAAKEARIQYDQMLAEHKRIEYLYQSNNISRNDYEKSKAGLERLKVNLDNALNRIKYTKLYAPVSGYVTKLNFEKAEMVNAGTPVIELMDNSSLEVNVDLPLEAYTKRGLFRSFRGITTDGKEFALMLLNITPKADNNQLYSMRLAVSAADSKLLTPGMNVEVNILRSDNVESQENESYSLPLHAIFYDKTGSPQVWVLQKDSTVKATAVEIGEPLTNGKIRILSGLNGGEQIVRAGVNSLQPGEKVKIIEDAKQTNVGSLL